MYGTITVENVNYLLPEDSFKSLMVEIRRHSVAAVTPAPLTPEVEAHAEMISEEKSAAKKKAPRHKSVADGESGKAVDAS